MSVYRIEKSLQLPAIDQEIADYWQAHQVFEASVEQRPAEKPFVFFEGPPSANGMPGIHHVMARTVKDMFCRFKTQQGFRVERKGGWDTHGLPIELQVEKELGITKEDIGKKITVEEYNQACRKTVMRYKDIWDNVTRRMGYWVDLDNPYVTFDSNYIESCWWLIQRLYEKRTARGERFLYKGFTIQPFSPAAGTGLSSHELNMPGTYQDVTDITIVAMFAVEHDEKSAFLFESEAEKVYIMAWTTTPWTLPSNVALTVGPHIDYAKVRTFNPYTGEKISVILARERVAAYFSPEDDALPFADFKAGDKRVPYNIVNARLAGSDLLGVRYKQLMPYVTTPELEAKAFCVIGGDWVTTEDGTGVVHTAPYFGADDFKACREAGIPYIGIPNPDNPALPLPLVDRQGRFVDAVTDFAGRYVKAEYYSAEVRADKDFKPTDLLIVLKLKTEGLAFRIEKYKHTYPHCWRTDKPVLYYPLDSWFIRASAAKERMAELNRTINWKPEHTGTGRFGSWLDNLQDWNLSRSRFWGIPLPVWRSADKTEEICIGSIEELKSYMSAVQRAIFDAMPDDLHRPYIDRIELTSPTTGQTLYRESDLIDVWFDSGAMPYAQWHYPFENKEKVDQKSAYPADFIAEGVDQTRGWFYTLHALSTMIFDQVAYKNVVSNGLVLDKNGNKMSKSLGNTVDPFVLFDKFGADATRWYIISNANPWDSLKFDESGIVEVRNKYFGTMFNTYQFFAIYANLDGYYYNPAEKLEAGERSELDRWMLSRLHTTQQAWQAAMEDYEPTRATRLLEDLLDQLSNWFVRLSRRRFWKGDMTTDKLAAYQTLFESLVQLAQMSAPLAPFFSDWLYQQLTDPIRKHGLATGTAFESPSVHLTLLTQPDETYTDTSLETRMGYAQRISSLALSIRKREKLRVRLPLARLIIPVLNPEFRTQIEAVTSLIQTEVNVKQIEFIAAGSGLLTKKARPNFKTVAARYGKDMKTLTALITGMSHDDITALEEAGRASYTQEGITFELEPADLLISTEDLPGLATAQDNELTVALDTHVTPELADEGLARDLVNRIQTMRKDHDLAVTDRISVLVSPHSAVERVLLQHGAYIAQETLADHMAVEQSLSSEPVELGNDISVSLAIQVVNA
jgi:isoleucyl-tRNA synthetase